MARKFWLAVAVGLTLLLAGCTAVDGRVYRVQWFKSGSCFVYVKGTTDGVTYYKAIRKGKNTTKAECYRRNEIGDRIRFTIDDESYRQDQ